MSLGTINSKESSGIQSMTGFGSVEGSINNAALKIDIKSLNHRFLDIKLRVPRKYLFLDQAIRKFFIGKLSRGSIEIKIEFLNQVQSEPEEMISINQSLAAHYFKASTELAKTLGVLNQISAIDLMKLPEVITSPTEDEGSPKIWEQLEPLLVIGLAKLNESRSNEGATLSQICHGHIAFLDSLQKQMIEKRKSNLKSVTNIFNEKIKTIFDAYPISQTNIQSLLESRISQELAILVDRTDITEELDRLAYHLNSFKDVLLKGGTAGKKLEFLTQEIGREINTLGSKSHDYQMSDLVIEAKVKNEQIREQILNIQ